MQLAYYFKKTFNLLTIIILKQSNYFFLFFDNTLIDFCDIVINDFIYPFALVPVDDLLFWCSSLPFVTVEPQ